ncbi:TetR/AcrR family transcriptional regulator [Streptomyces sp. NBC_01218]|uniref:TetR/AcrR family transcriptional regulator n=1 Tax=unclassified Streptomyces TaxID=2593676 RepID=UPI0023B9D90B|nr:MULTISPECIES: TetR/AcrR family transcriptional regulator [unclassified Streptomyces]WEH41919.1 TetR/AcrR family transcriptional regulator [Streptomyces sp. AM 2-1-1]WSQ53530.1 TetR/AcrR family transcriptional regulator [Streptomyces sp. NBC_01218]
MTSPPSPAPGLRERKKRATREALADTALRMAAEHGLDQVTVEAVTESVGVSVRTFFNYFAHLDDAILVPDPDSAGRTRAAVLSAPAELGPLAVLRRVLGEEMAHIEDAPERWELQCTVLGRTPSLFPRFLAARGADEEALISAVAQRLGQDPTSGLRSRLLVHAAVAAVRAAVEIWTATGRTRAFLTLYDEAFDELSAGLGD